MEQTKEDTAEVNPEQVIEENFAWEEWSVVDDGQSTKNHKNLPSDKNDDASSDESFSHIDNASDAEEARECVEVMLQKNLEESQSVTADDNKSNEESDGVSVITESDAEEPTVEEAKIVSCENEPRMAVMKLAERRETELSNFRMIFFIVSSLLGLAILCIAINSWTRKNPNDLHFDRKMSCNDVYRSISEFGNVHDFEEETEYDARIDRSTNSVNNLFESLHIFRGTLCWMMKKVQRPDSPQLLQCETNSILPKLKSLQTLLKNTVNDMNTPERTSHERFLENVEFQAETMSEELATHFIQAVDKLMMKREKKLEKLADKLAERLCVLRNTLPSDNKHRQALEDSDIFDEDCDKIIAEKIKDQHRKNVIKESTDSPKQEKKHRKERQDKQMKRQNNTRSNDEAFEKRDNSWDTRKSYDKNLPNIPDQEFDDTCAVLTAPPKSNSEINRKSSYTMKQRKDFDRKKKKDKYHAKIQMKDDEEPLASIKPKLSKEFDKRKNDKPDKRSFLGKAIDEAKKSQKIAADMKNKRIYPPHPTGRNDKPDKRNFLGKAIDEAKKSQKKAGDMKNKRFEKEDNKFILLNKNEEKPIQDDGHWQFDRSQFRDQLRKDESTGNWQFDRSQFRDELRKDESTNDRYSDKIDSRKNSRQR